MSEFRIRSIDASLSAQVRGTLKDPVYGLPVSVEPATGFGPCRLCLRTFSPGEPRILFLYNPFSAAQEADVAGPVFVHAEPCRPYADASLFPEEVAQLPVVLRAYDAHRRCLLEMTPRPGGVTASIEACFGVPGVALVHVRNAEAKCFIAAIERSSLRSDQPNVLVSSR